MGQTGIAKSFSSQSSQMHLNLQHLGFPLLSDFLTEFYFHSIVSSKEKSNNSKSIFQSSEGRIK